MVTQGTTKIIKSGYRHFVYLPKDLVEDSAFPFKPRELLVARIDGDTVVLSRNDKA